MLISHRLKFWFRLFLILTIGLLATSSSRFSGTGTAQSTQTLTATLFFDGSANPNLADFRFNEPVVDSQGRLLVIGGQNFTQRLFSISPEGTLNWQAPGSSDTLPFDSFSGYTLLIGPGDRIYTHTTHNRIFAFDSSGQAIPGWPVENIIPPDTTEPNWAMAGVIVDSQDGTVYAKSGVFSSFTSFPSTVVAFNPDASMKWRKSYGSGSKNFHLVQGPARDIYTLIDSTFVGIDHGTGTQVCQNNISVFFGSLVGGLEGVATSFRDGISGQDVNCNSQLIFPSTDREVVLQRYDHGIVLALDYPVFPFDPNQTRLLGVSQNGTFLWRNSDIFVSPFGASPIHVIKAGIMYVFGQDLADSNKPKLFLVNTETGQVLNSIETTSFCANCGVAVADDGSVYVNDRDSTKIYKLAGDVIPNQPPTAGFTMTSGSNSATEGHTLNLTAPTGPVFVEFSADRSSDVDGTIGSWEWRIDEVVVSTASSFTQGLSHGNHIVSLLVTDDDGAQSQVATGNVVITSPVLQLFFSNDGDPNHPFDIRSENVTRANERITADVVITNRCGTWFQLDIAFDSPSTGASTPVSDNSINTNFLIGPFGEVRFRTTFHDGEYLHFDATRLSPAAISILGIDAIGRGLFGVELSASHGSLVKLDLAILQEFLREINSAGCAANAFATGFGISTCTGTFRMLCIINELAQFLKCTVTNPQVRAAIKKLITRLYGSQAAKKWIESGAKTIADILLIIENVPRLVELIDNTVAARPTGLVRLEARRS
ncbi:MAG TPA: hypothetical protein VGD61_11395 [Pyrinomonadaceae bacterium]